MMKKIGIDARCLQEGQRTGVAEYAVGVFKHLFSSYPEKKFVLFFNSFHKINLDLDWTKEFENISVRKFSFPNKMINLFFWLLNWPKIDKILGVDAFFVPNPSFIALSNKCKKIITIHDLSFERFPETFSFKRRLWHFMVNPRKLCRKSDQIWAVSKSTKQDLISLYKIDSTKISVAFPPFNFDKFSGENLEPVSLENIRKKYQLPSDFILFNGTIEPRKNISALVDAFEQLKREEGRRRGDLKLVVAGGSGWLCDEILSKIKKSFVKDDIILTGFVDGKDKPYLYHLAKIFVYPSIFEGFGYPPIEAMASGTPTITSNCSSIPEVVGDSALLIDPYRPYEIAIALRLLLSDEKIYNHYSKRGKERARGIANLNREWQV